MFKFVQHNLWELFIAIEIIFWLCIVSFLLIRYVLGWRKISVWILPIFITSVVADIYLGWVDYKTTGEFSIFQFIVIIALIYIVTSGLADFRRLDAYIQRKVATWKGQPEPELNVQLPPKYGREHAKHERYGWYMHVLMFVLAQFAFFALFGVREHFSIYDLFDFQFYRLWWVEEGPGLYNDLTLNQIVKGWFLVLVLDGIISLSYTFSPRKEKSK